MNVTGLVTDGAQPVPDARVILLIGGEVIATLFTDDHGRFEHRDQGRHIGRRLVCRVEKNGIQGVEKKVTIEGPEVYVTYELRRPVSQPSFFQKYRLWIAAAVALFLVSAAIVYVLAVRTVFVREFKADPPKISQGDTTELRWKTFNADRVTINGQTVESSGSRQEKPREKKVYTLVASKANGKQVTRSVTVDVSILPIIEFKAVPSEVEPGQVSRLSWKVKHATEVRMNGEKVPSSGSREVRPTVPMSFTMLAVNEDGKSVETTISVGVSAAVRPPEKKCLLGIFC